MQNKIHSVRYNFIMNFLLTATNFIFPLITFPYISRVLQSTGTGTITFVATVANYFLMAANLGIPTYGIRACAKARDDKAALTKVCHELLIINAVTTAISLVTFLILVAIVPHFREEKTLFYINGLNIVLNLFGMQWLYQGLEQYDYITVRSVAFKIASVILLFLLVHNESDYLVYGFISVFAAAGSNVLNAVHSRKLIDWKPQGHYEFRKHIKPILVLFTQTMIVSIYTNLDTVMLGFMKDNSEVGLYTTAVKVKGILLSLVASLGTVLLPRMSNVVKQGDSSLFNELTKKSLNITMLMAFPLSVFFCIFSKESVLLLAGEGFLGAVLAMQIITPAVIPNGLTGVLGVQVLTSIEKEKYVLYSVTAGAVIDFILNLWLIPFYGAAGAALATAIAEFVVLFVQIYYTRNILKAVAKQLLTHVYIVATVVAALASQFVLKMVQLDGLFVIMCVAAGVFFGTYGVVLCLLKEPLVMQYISKLKTLICKKKFPKGENEYGKI